MGFTTTLVSGIEDKKQPIVIDWSGFIDEQTGSDDNIEQMIAWLKTYPRSKDIHVYLGKVRQKQLGKKLQSALQALGCRVTTRQFASV